MIETKKIIQFIQTDAGRSLSKRKKQTNDCVIRAISIVTNRSYDEIYDEFKILGRKCGRGTKKMIWKPYLENIGGIKTSFPAVKGFKRMNLISFLESYKNGKWIIQHAGHIFPVINGIVYDNTQPNPYKCIYSAWEFKNEI